MILTTTPTIEGKPIKEYLGIVTGETIIGANIWKDFKAAIRDVVGVGCRCHRRHRPRL